MNEFTPKQVQLNLEICKVYNSVTYNATVMECSTVYGNKELKAGITLKIKLCYATALI